MQQHDLWCALFEERKAFHLPFTLLIVTFKQSESFKFSDSQLEFLINNKQTQLSGVS